MFTTAHITSNNIQMSMGILFLENELKIVLQKKLRRYDTLSIVPIKFICLYSFMLVSMIANCSLKTSVFAYDLDVNRLRYR